METTALNQKKLGFDNHFALDTNGFDFSMVNFIVSHLQPKSKFLTMPLKQAQSRSLSLEISLYDLQLDSSGGRAQYFHPVASNPASSKSEFQLKMFNKLTVHS